MRILLDSNVLVSAFVLNSPRMLALIDAITLNHTLVLPSYVAGELRDVASAIAADVDVLLSGDGHFAPLDMRRPEVMTPRQFLEKYG